MKPVIMQQIVMNLSILAAVVLSLHNFITNLTAGRFGVEVHESTDERSKTSGEFMAVKKPAKKTMAAKKTKAAKKFKGVRREK